MIRFLAKKNNNKKNEKAYGKYYAKVSTQIRAYPLV